MVSGALNEQAARLTDVFFCENGHFAYAGKTLHDHEAYGDLTMENIITHSSNIGAAKIAIERLHETKLYQYMRAFGFGTRTGIPLEGESPGLVHPPDAWSKVSIAQIPMGQGVEATPLQMIMAMSAIANGGVLMKPMLVDRLTDEDGKTVMKYQPQPVRRVISATAAQEMVEALTTVTSSEGTAPAAHLNEFSVAGKTGTSQKVDIHEFFSPGSSRKIVTGTYSGTRFFSSFIGFFPAGRPELCIGIIMDEPKDGHYGGKVCAPIFKAVAERAANYLNLKPDTEPVPAPPRTILAAGPSRGGND